ncbi:protocadherin gamma-B5-like [Mixophyes fleayi]|uniref:protocadherin gamma-B5-like n=1 Tax=Mixophyes fleayi TaxID=3061075 RepID=UPI003F4DCAD3
MGENIQRTMTWQVFLFLICFHYDAMADEIHYSIYEEVKQGFVIGNVANDLGLDSKTLSSRKMQIVSHTKKQYFNVSLANGNVYVTDRIDREALCGIDPSCILNIEILVENPVAVFHVAIEIQDMNDNAPVFAKNIFEILISESAAPGTRFPLGNAQDPDLSSHSVQSYMLSSSQQFVLGEKISRDGLKHPELLLERPLDREKQSSYNLILTASDGGIPIKTGTASIKIIVQDANDNYPVFSQDTYQISLHEDVPNGFLVLHLNASDEDEGSNAHITYSFNHIPENARQNFSLDPESGEIRSKGALDFEVTKNYEMTVEAKDGGGLVTHCRISIQIVDVNDNQPDIIIKSLAISVPEDSIPGTLIALINVHDEDSGSNGAVTCQILNRLPFDLILTSLNYYKLITAAPLDREKVSEYNIRIMAEDDGSPSLSTNKSIHLVISDVNDNPPMFHQISYIGYIIENNQPGASIYGVHASDSDFNENSRTMYSLLNTKIEEIPLASYVSINSMSGVIYAQRSFDYEQLREFQFQVMAKDSGSPPLSSNVTVRICIIDKNDNAPKILYPSPDTEGSALFEFIPHSAEKGYLVTKVIAVDADSGHNAWLSYHLLQVPDPSLFTIGQQTGEIRIGRDLPDTESLRQKIVVLVKDNGVPSLSATVTLNLVVAETFQQFEPEIRRQPSHSDTASNTTFYLVIAIALISILFIVTVLVTIIYKCHKTNTPTSFEALSRNVYPQFTLGCPSEISDGSLPFPFSYDVCVTLDSKQNEIAYLKPVQNVPTDNLIDTDDSSNRGDVSSSSITQVSY